jgi:AraC family transcriptional regulator of adaptative response / DNA-3-methyladenine glycosylase II
MDLDQRVCDRARRSRDARFDGRFFIAVTTTGVYCRPICPARAPKDEHVRYFPTAAAAEAVGFRPCLRCRPEASPGTPAWLGTSGIVSRALRMIGDGALRGEGAASVLRGAGAPGLNKDVEQLAGRLGVTARHLRRLFLQHLGATPLDVALTRRVHFAKKLLDETSLAFHQVAIASGFGSLRRFNGQIRRTYSRTPTQLRRLARQKAAADPDCYRFRLAYRPPYDWDAMLAFLSARATPGVESVIPAPRPTTKNAKTAKGANDEARQSLRSSRPLRSSWSSSDGSRYRRTISVDGRHGSIEVSRLESRSALSLEVRFPDPRALLFIVERVKAMFDLGADPAIIAEHLRADPLLRGPLAKHPGIRTPGAWDGFELAVRAILGQQISVRAATTMAGRIATMFGSPAISGDQSEWLFPTPAQLAHAAIERAGVVSARAETIRSLARRVADATITFNASVDAREMVSVLKDLPGIGDWTAEYIAMRALGEPDAFPSGDLVLRRMAGGCAARELDRRSASWRPWRAYAVMLLWQSARDEHDTSLRRRHAQRDGRSKLHDGNGRSARVSSAHGAT